MAMTRSKPFIDNEVILEDYNQDMIFMSADRFKQEQDIQEQMMIDLMNDRRAILKEITELEHEKVEHKLPF